MALKTLLFLSIMALLQACGSTSESENAAPAVNVTINSNVAVGVQLSLSATATDPEGDSLQYSWSIINSPTGSAATLTDANLPTMTFTPDVEGDYVIQLVVDDGINLVTQVGTVQAMLGNIAPTAIITNVAIVALNSSVQLDGSNSTDPNNDTLSYRWVFLSIPSGSQATISDARSAQPTFTADLGGDYQVQLMVNDGEFDSTPATTTITASAFSITVSWQANTDNPAGYTVYVGTDASTTDQLVKILIRDATDWVATAPEVVLGGDTILNALPAGSTQACFVIRAYNGVGLSAPSMATCQQLP